MQFWSRAFGIAVLVMLCVPSTALITVTALDHRARLQCEAAHAPGLIFTHTPAGCIPSIAPEPEPKPKNKSKEKSK